MLIFGANVLQYYGRYSVPLRACVEFNPCASKRHLHGRTFGRNDSLKGCLLFRKRNPQRLLMGIADRGAEPIYSLADSNNK